MMLVRTLIQAEEETLPVSLQEVSELFSHIRASLGELDGLERAASVMVEELQSFLESYYARVLPLTARLERLRYRKEHGIFPNRSVAMDLSPPPLDIQPDMLALKKKALFRKLVKQCHPDNLDANAPVDIAEIYEAKTIGALWLLIIRCGVDTLESDEAINRYLEQQRAEIGQLTLQALSHARHFKQTDQWELKERVCNAALEGIDLIQHIQHRIEKQIAALQQYFVKPKEFQAAN